MKDIKSSITIAATPQEVWQVLVDLEHYHEWNPMFVEAKGTIAADETLDIKIRLPVRFFCGVPFSFSWSPKVTKLEPNASLEWCSSISGMSDVVNGTHYFQLSCTNDGTSTEFTQGRRYEGVGSSLCSGFNSMEDARRGLTTMNKALQMETTRRKSMIKSKEPLVDEKKEEEIAQLDISDSTAVAAATAAAVLSSSTIGDTIIEERDIAIEEKRTTTEENAATDEMNTSEVSVSDPTEKAPQPHITAPITRRVERLAGRTHEKRTSIIGAVSFLFGSTKPSAQDHLTTSTSKIDLLSKALEEEQEDDDHDQEIEEEECKENEIQVDDPEAKNAREVKNSERIELDLGSSDIDLGDFGI